MYVCERKATAIQSKRSSKCGEEEGRIVKERMLLAHCFVLVC